MKKILSVITLAAITCSAMADVWYCDPASTKDKAQALDWESAISPAGMRKSLAAMYSDDTLAIKGGTIHIQFLSDLWEITEQITVIGGFDPDLKGTDLTMPTYPSATPTIFDGDNNGNGIGDTLDAQALIRVNLETGRDKKVTLQGLVLRNTFYYNATEGSDDVVASMAKASALRLICGTTFVKNCEIYNNVTPINEGSQSVMVVGAKAHFQDCDIHHGVCLSRGGLIRERDYYINQVKSNPISPSLVLERCCLHDGSCMGGQKYTSKGPYGGAVHASSGDVFAINSTFVLDSCNSKGGAIRPNPSGLTAISCTFGQNFGCRKDDPAETSQKFSYGSSIGADSDTPLRFMNTIMLDDKDGGSKANAPLYTDGNETMIDEFFFSNDYNIMGTCFIYVNGSRVEPTAQEFIDLWKSNDQYQVNKNNDFTRVFGDVYTNLMDNGGCCKTIMPISMLFGPTVADLQAYANQYCPKWTKVDASVDQRGYVRSTTQTCIGAAAVEAKKPSALNNLQSSISNLQSSTYNVLGQPVDQNYKGIVIYKGKKYLVK